MIFEFAEGIPYEKITEIFGSEEKFDLAKAKEKAITAFIEQHKNFTLKNVTVSDDLKNFYFTIVLENKLTYIDFDKKDKFKFESILSPEQITENEISEIRQENGIQSISNLIPFEERSVKDIL